MGAGGWAKEIYDGGAEREKEGSHHAKRVPTFTSDCSLQAVEQIKWNGGTGGMFECVSVTKDGDGQSETDLRHK